MKTFIGLFLFCSIPYLNGYQDFESAGGTYKQPNGVTFEARYSGGRTFLEKVMGNSTIYIDPSFTFKYGGLTEAIYTVKALDTDSPVSPVSNSLSAEGIGALVKPSLLDAKSWYPLQDGNRWQYRVYQQFADSTSIWYYASEIVGDSTMDNQLSYRVLRRQKLTGEFLEDIYLRCDTTLNTIYEYQDTLSCPNSEIVIADFSSDPNEGFWQDCLGFDWQSSYYYNEIDTPVVIMGVTNDLYGRIYTYQHELGMILYQEDEVGINYEEKLIAAEIDGSQWGEFYTGINEIRQVPDDFGLTAIYPNPSNAAVSIQYRTPSDKTRVRVLIFDLSGRQVYRSATISSSGNHEGVFIWDGLNSAGKPLPSGVYVATLETITSRNSKIGSPFKFTLIK